MKSKLTLLLVLLCSFVTLAQRGINYKAVIEENNSPVVSQAVEVKFRIAENTPTNFVYEEEHSVTTNGDGLAILNIGEGTVNVVGNFSALNWGNFDHFLEVQVKTIASGVFVPLGTTEFKSVPYAYHAENVEFNNINNVTSNTPGDMANDDFVFGSSQLNHNAVPDTDDYRMFFDKSKGAFRAGTTHNFSGASYPDNGFAWNETNIGNSSFAVGYNTAASGISSMAFGSVTNASGNFSTALGGSTEASGQHSFATGLATKAEGYNSTTTGQFTKATGSSSFAHGISTIAEGYSTLAIGMYNIGGGNSLPFGGPTNPLFEIGNGSATNVRSNALTVLQNGTITAPTFTIPLINTAGAKALVTKEYVDGIAPGTGLEKITEGGKTGWRLIDRDPSLYGDIGNNAVDFSVSTRNQSPYGALGNNSLAIGDNTIAAGGNSLALGSETATSNLNTFAMGFESSASGQNSFAGGEDAKATGKNSFAFGNEPQAVGIGSFAIGLNSYAFGSYSASFGEFTQATGEYSFACGENTIASGQNAFSTGDWTRANAISSFAIGRYNIGGGDATTWIATDALFEVGNGTSDIARANAFTIYKNGDATLAGILTQNSDRRLKSDISTLSYGLKDILKLNPVEYNWKSRPDEKSKSLGLIAQEVQSVIAGIVHKDNSKNELLSVSYTELIPVLIKAIQEQQEIITQQKINIQNQKELNSKYTNEINNLNNGLEALLERVETIETSNK